MQLCIRKIKLFPILTANGHSVRISYYYALIHFLWYSYTTQMKKDQGLLATSKYPLLLLISPLSTLRNSWHSPKAPSRASLSKERDKLVEHVQMIGFLTHLNILCMWSSSPCDTRTCQYLVIASTIYDHPWPVSECFCLSVLDVTSIPPTLPCWCSDCQ